MKSRKNQHKQPQSLHRLVKELRRSSSEKRAVQRLKKIFKQHQECLQKLQKRMEERLHKKQTEAEKMRKHLESKHQKALQKLRKQQVKATRSAGSTHKRSRTRGSRHASPRTSHQSKRRTVHHSGLKRKRA